MTKQIRLEVVQTATLKIDPNYQRALDEKRVQRMSTEWDDALASALTISRRNGSSYVIDGQQRLAAARLRMLRELPALVHEGLSPSEEAALFVGLNTEARRPSFFAIYRARLVAADEHAIWLADLLHTKGLVAVDHMPRRAEQLRAIQVLWTLGKVDPRSVREALDVIIEAWPDDLRRFESHVLNGVWGFIHVYRDHPRYEQRRLTAKLGEGPAKTIYQRAKELGGNNGGNGANAAARAAVLERYNRHLREGLDAVTQAQLKNLSMGRRIWEP